MLRSALLLLAALLLPTALLAQTATTTTSTTTTTTPAPLSHDAMPPPGAAMKSTAAPAPAPVPATTTAITSTTVKGPDNVTATKTTSVTITDPENTIFLDTVYGRVIIQLQPSWAPKTVARIKELVRKNFYDGLLFHRVIDGFMAQTGDPRGDGTGGSGQKLAAEFNPTHHARGIVSMARAADVNSADSQFFIVTGDSGFLDNQYTAFGQVISGMEFVDQLKKGSRANNGSVSQPDKIVHMRVAADVK
jgi:cyclophilin family peptidyl-prolyl cis-trans isomerase